MRGKGGVYTALIGPIASLEEVHMIFEVSASIAVSGVRDGNRREQTIGPETWNACYRALRDFVDRRHSKNLLDPGAKFTIPYVR